MAKLAYWQKLKDPRWQKLRLEKLSSNDFCCEVCGDDESTLHVHHKEYFKGLEPWEYQLRQLAVLCETCHEYEHESLDLLKWVCSMAYMDGPNSRTEIAFMVGGYMGFPYEGLLSVSGLEPCRGYKTYHAAGVKAQQHKESLFDKWWARQQKAKKDGKN
jgi:hypothetical protein